MLDLILENVFSCSTICLNISVCWQSIFIAHTVMVSIFRFPILGLLSTKGPGCLGTAEL